MYTYDFDMEEEQQEPTPSLLRHLPISLKHTLRDSRLVHDVLDVVTSILTIPKVIQQFHLLFSSSRRFTAEYAEARHCDVYTSASKHISPLIIFVHGGAWGTGNRHMYRLLGHSLQSQNINVVVPSYPTYPESDALEQASCIRQCIRWCKDHITTDRIYLIGHSSGAHICALALTDGCCGLEKINGFVGTYVRVCMCV